ncbi:MAG: universal stress protein [Propionibacteriaceae bacterium]
MAEDHPYTVVVGVSVTSKSPRALTWAHHQARSNGGRLVAVRAWRTPAPQATPSGETAGRISRSTEVEAEAMEALTADVAATLGPDHDAELRLRHGGKWTVLVEAAVGADLLVVDAPRQLLVGPMFAHQLIYAATCPVVVMPPEAAGDGPALAGAARAFGRSIVAAAGTAGRPGYRPPLIR